MENLSPELRPVVEWTPPANREDADQAILSLSNDIGLILAQLAEDQPDWCGRTGRSAADYSAWRRRALFAKVHKEGQLRECKRIRSQLSAGGGAEDAVRGDREVVELLVRSRDVVEAWLDGGATSGSVALDGALSVLAEQLDRLPAVRGVSLLGARAVLRPVVVEASEA
jgi:hypothetical protein